MDPLTASVIAAGIGYLGTQDTNAMQAGASQAQMDFQERMSNTAYQRQVADLQAAGLNPMLAYIKGGGASTPSGAMPVYSNPAATAASAFQNVALGRQSLAQAAYTSGAQTAQTEAQTKLTEAQTAQAEKAADKIGAEIDLIKGDTNFEQQQAKLRQTVYMLNQQGNLYQEQGMTQGQTRAVQQATIEKLVSENKLLKLDIKAAEAFENFGREYKQYAPIVDLLKSVLTLKRTQ